MEAIATTFWIKYDTEEKLLIANTEKKDSRITEKRTRIRNQPLLQLSLQFIQISKPAHQET